MRRHRSPLLAVSPPTALCCLPLLLPAVPTPPAVPTLVELEVRSAEGLGRNNMRRMMASPGLTRLQLQECELRELPAALRQCVRLIELDLSGNRLDRNLKPLDGLTALTRLTLRGAGCTALPAALSALSANLAELDLSGCRYIRGGWQHLAGLGSLQQLHLNRTAIEEELPAALAALSSLTLLDLTAIGVARRRGLHHLRGLPLLRLSLRGCLDDALPPVLSSLTALTMLDISSSPLASGWEHLAPLAPHLRCLVALNCNIGEGLPLVVGSLTALTMLDLGMWPGSSQAGQLAPLLQLPELRTLSLRACGLKALPKELSGLTCLETLFLDANDGLAGGWLHLAPPDLPVPTHTRALRAGQGAQATDPPCRAAGRVQVGTVAGSAILLFAVLPACLTSPARKGGTVGLSACLPCGPACTLSEFVPIFRAPQRCENDTLWGIHACKQNPKCATSQGQPTIWLPPLPLLPASLRLACCAQWQGGSV